MPERWGPFTAVIGDVVGSRRFRGAERATLQQRLEDLLGHLNRTYRPSIQSQFVLTEGDSFQALLKLPRHLPAIIWDIEDRLREIEIRLGLGHGMIETELKPKAIGMDGPAFHAAREALEIARKERLLGGVFQGYGPFEDRVLNAFAHLLRHVRSGLTDQQRTIANLLRRERGRTQTSVARELGITRQAVNEHMKRMGWQALVTGESAWSEALERFSQEPVTEPPSQA